jgi:chemotaxis protein MotB
MMAFFLLMWLLGATNEKQRKALADYFAPTLIEFKQNSAGSNGLLGGDALQGKDNYPTMAKQTGTRSMTIPAGAEGGDNVGTGQVGSLKNKEMAAADRKGFAKMKAEIEKKIRSNPGLTKLGKQVRFVPTREGMRIDRMDDADYSMFAVGTTNFVPDAAKLVALVAQSIAEADNPIMVRGHTDSLRYGDPTNMNNWMLSSARSEETRRRLVANGVPEARFERIEGVADREPLIADNPADPRNRRVAITLLYRKSKLDR